MWPFESCLTFADLPTATAALVAAFGDDGTGNPDIDPTQVCIDYVGAAYNALADTWDGKENINIASINPLPDSLSSAVVTPVFQKRVFADDSLPGFAAILSDSVVIDPDLAGS